MPNPIKQFTLCLSLILLLSVGVLAVESMPPIVPEGEYAENVEELLINIQGRHSGPINSVAFSPDGKMIASGADDGLQDYTVRLWDVTTGKEIRRLKGHAYHITSVHFSPDGKKIISSSWDKTIRLWDMMTGKEIRRIEGNTFSICSAMFSPDGKIVAACYDSYDSSGYIIQLWDAVSGKEIRHIEGNTSSANSMSFSPDGKNIASGSSDHTVRLWDVQTGREKSVLHGHTDSVRSVCFSPDGKTIATGADDNTVRLWNAKTGREIRHIKGHDSDVISVKFSPDSRIIASGSDDNTVRLWDTETGKEIWRMEDHAESVNSVSFSPDGKTLVSGSSDNTLRVWDVTTGKEVRTIRGYNEYKTKTSMSFSPDGKKIASGTEDYAVCLWDVESGNEIRRIQGNNYIKFIAFSPDSRTIASGAEEYTIRLVNVETGKEIRRLRGHSGSVNSVSFSPDEITIASGSDDGTVRLWDLKTGKEILQIQGHARPVRSVSFSSDSKYLASCYGGFWLRDAIVLLSDVATGKEVRRMIGHTASVNSVNFSPDGKKLASGSEDGTVRLWDTRTGKEILCMRGHGSWVNSVSFSPDGKFLASCSGVNWPTNNTVRVWEVESGKEIQRLEGHNRNFWSVSFSPNGKTLAAWSDDRTLWLWDADSGRSLWVLLAKQNENWLSYNVKEKRFWRYDDGTFLRIPPPEPKEKGNLKIFSKPENLNIDDSNLTEFSIKVQNTGKGPLYWLHTGQEINKENPLLLHPTLISSLEPNQITEIPCKVSAHFDYINPKGQNTELHFHIKILYGKPVSLNIPVNTRVPEFQILEAKLEKTDKPVLTIMMKNSGEQGLRDKADFSAKLITPLPLPQGEREQSLDTVSRTQVKAGEVFNLSFAVPEKFKIPKDLKVNLSVVKQTAPPFHIWELPAQAVILPTPPWILYTALSAFLLLTVIALYFLRLFLHPLTVQLSNNPESLLRMPIEQMEQARNLLKKTRRLDSVLTKAEIPKPRIKQALAFYPNSDPEFRCNTLTEHMEATCEPLPNGDLKLFRLKMNPDFMLNMDQCILAFPEPEMSASQILARLKQNSDIRQTTCMIISTEIKQQSDLRKESLDAANWFVTPDSRELTNLLLSPHPTEAFARVVSSQIGFSRISPYQTRSGVNREGVFFGRTQLLAHIMNREPANYLLIGGRQIGKSSLLKAIERRYRNDPDTECHYLVLTGEDIREHLAKEMNLPLDTDWPELSLTMENTSGPRRLFLIDEADRFVAAESRRDYQTLHLFRGLSEEGRCHFILAGFWHLYHAATFDYQSPVKNFAETLTISALEPDACRRLATEPMHLLNISYESEDMIETIVRESGQRANLIAIICDEMLKKPESGQKRILESGNLESVLDSQAVRAAFGGWTKLSGNESSDRMDRIIVWVAAGFEKLSLTDIFAILDQQQYRYEPEQVTQSLERLELGFVLKRETQSYSFCVPLFRKLILAQQPEKMLEREVKSVFLQGGEKFFAPTDL